MGRLISYSMTLRLLNKLSSLVKEGLERYNRAYCDLGENNVQCMGEECLLIVDIASSEVKQRLNRSEKKKKKTPVI